MSGRDKDKKRRPDKAFKVNPFESLKSLKSQLRSAPSQAPSPQAERPKKTKNRLPTADDPYGEPNEMNEKDESKAFAEAMSGVVPLTDRERVAIKCAEKQPRTMDEAAAIDAHLRDLIDGVIPFDIADTDEFIEGSIHGFDRNVLRKLRRGEFALQDHIDLHGYIREDARLAVAKFIRSAHERGLRCVLIVHGRGLRSKDQIPVLKEKLKAWLTRGSIGTKVLAFASARPYDGGTGAGYVLLRR